MSPSCGELRKKSNVEFLVGIATISLGVILLALHTWVPNYFFTSIFVLKPNSPIINLWLKNPMEIRMNFYFFNWTNPEEFYNADVKPKFNQVGPYPYLFDTEKINVKWNNNNTVTHEILRSWSLIDEYKDLCTNYKITTVNAVTLISASILKNWSTISKKIASIAMTLNAPELHMVGSAQTLLFEGHDHFIINILNATPFVAPEEPYRFAWMLNINQSSTHEGIFNSGNGVNGNFDLLRWNYETHNPYLNSGCSNVRGSAGEFFNNIMDKDYITVFLPMACRPAKFDFEKKVVVDRITGHKFSAGSSLFDNGTRVEGNDCYCTGECTPSGMLNFTACLLNSPLFGSLPHYLEADPIYLNTVEGLKPEKINHESYIVVEPTTGIPLEALLRLQINLLIQPIEGISVVQDVRKIFFPVFWLEFKVEVPSSIKVIIIIYLILPYVILAVGLLLIVLGSYLLLYKTFKPIVWEFLNIKTARSTEVKQTEEEKPLQSML